jgi:hypothetical protein
MIILGTKYVSIVHFVGDFDRQCNIPQTKILGTHELGGGMGLFGLDAIGTMTSMRHNLCHLYIKYA